MNPCKFSLICHRVGNFPSHEVPGKSFLAQFETKSSGTVRPGIPVLHRISGNRDAMFHEHAHHTRHIQPLRRETSALNRCGLFHCL